MLRSAPGVEDGDLVHAGNRALGRTGFFGEEFSAKIVAGVLFQRDSGVAALLRAVVDQAVLANIKVARTGAAPPLVGLALRDVVLEGVDAGETALLHRLHFVIDAAFFRAQRLQ